MSIHTFSILADFPNQAISSTCLDLEINASNITANLDGINVEGDSVIITFAPDLNSTEIITLGTIISSHTGTCPAQIQQDIIEQDPVIPIFEGNAKNEVYYYIGRNDDLKGNFFVQQMSVKGNYTFIIPSNFTQLVELSFVFIPKNTISAGATIDLFSDYGKLEENFMNNSETQLGVLISGNADDIKKMDISSVYSNLEAGDFCSLKIDSIPETLYGICIILRYN